MVLHLGVVEQTVRQMNCSQVQREVVVVEQTVRQMNYSQVQREVVVMEEQDQRLLVRVLVLVLVRLPVLVSIWSS
jgi:hypothetical protein